MTFIAEPVRESRALAWVRIGTLAVLLAIGALGSPWPWGLLWFTVPATVAVTLLLAWRYGRPAIAVPVVMIVGAFALTAGVGTSLAPLWLTVWAPLGAVAGTWMGLREEGGGPSIGERAWMLVPMLVFAAVLPFAPGFSAAIGRLDLKMARQQELLAHSPEMAQAPAGVRDAFTQALRVPAAERQKQLGWMVPNLMFLCMVLLVAAGRTLAARVGVVLGWPALSRSPLHRWRLPDAALVPLIAGIALLVFADRTVHPSAWTLLVHSALGYSVQGVAVVESVLLARGMPPVFVALTMLFVIALSLLWVLPAIAVVGLSDVWLDYRRLEPSPRGDA